MKHRRLQEMDHSDFQVVEGEPDIRGWDVKLADGKKIGEVEDLIIDAQLRKVRYMLVDLDDNDLDIDTDKKVLVPIGLAMLDQKEDDVLLSSVNAQQLMNLPAYDRDHLDARTEHAICDTLGRQNNSRTVSTSATEGLEPDAEFYKHDYYNDDNLYKHRLHETDQKKEQSESEYERGLRLWEKRSEGGIINDQRAERTEGYRQQEMPEASRMELVRSRRTNYEQRRYKDNDGRSRERGKTIEDRIRDEGLQDA